MTLPFAVRFRAHTAGMEELAHRVLAGGRSTEDLAALADGPLPVLGALVSAVAPKEAAVVGLLIYPQVAAFETNQAKGGFRMRLTGTGGRFQRVSQWLRDSF